MSKDTSDSMTESSLFTDEQLAPTDRTPVDIWARVLFASPSVLPCLNFLHL